MKKKDTSELVHQPKEFLAKFYDFVPSYDTRNDVDFYKKIAHKLQSKKKDVLSILELGSGTGRILISLAKEGYSLTGLDLSMEMINKCWENLSTEFSETQNRVDLVHGSMTDFKLNKTFDIITAPFHCFQHLIYERHQIESLHHINTHLKKDGLFVLDLSSIKRKPVKKEDLPKEKIDFKNIDIGKGVLLSRTKRTVSYNEDNQLWNLELNFEINYPNGNNKKMSYAFPYKYFSLKDVEKLFRETGFKIDTIFGDYNFSPFDENSSEMIILGRK